MGLLGDLEKKLDEFIEGGKRLEEKMERMIELLEEILDNLSVIRAAVEPEKPGS